MTETLLWILAITILDGLIALVGVFSLAMRDKTMRRIIYALVALSAGTLLGGGLMHLLAESFGSLDVDTAMMVFIVGFSVFFVVERVLHWHHCHEGECDVHAYSYLILFGDGIHNFIDGLVIAAAFMTSINIGIVASILIFLHEIPQELGNFAVLLHGGMKKRKALLYNFAAQITAVAGGLVGYFMPLDAFETLMLPFAAGGFVYIAASDLIPELHKEPRIKKAILAFLFFAIGVAFMAVTKIVAGS